MKTDTKNKIIKLSIIILAFVLILLAIYLPLKLSGTFDKIDSAEELKQIILDGGIYSYLIFFAIQFLQVVFLPIPAFVTTVAGTLVFGPWIAMLISVISVILASIFSFYIGRKFGKKLVMWVIGKEDTIKWGKKLSRGKYVFFLMMLFPIFPDDILCMVVGATTSITYKFFIITNLITRPIGIASTCFIGSGELIPFSGWGIPVWIILIIIGAILFYLSIKYQPQIEEFINKFANKLTHLFSKTNKKPNTNNTNNIENDKNTDKNLKE